MYKTYNVITQPGLERKLKAYFVLFPKHAYLYIYWQKKTKQKNNNKKKQLIQY